MPKNNETTTKFKVDISELKSAMQEAKRQVALANSEFKAVSSALDDWATSSDGISAKLKQLDTTLKAQEKMLDSLEEQYKLTVKEMGEGSKEADNLKIAINNQKAAINNTKKEIGKFETSLDDVSKAEKVAAETGKSVDEVLKDMKTDTKKAGDAADNAATGGFTVFKGALADLAADALKKALSGVRNLASSLMDLGVRADDLNTISAQSGFSTEMLQKMDYAADRIDVDTDTIVSAARKMKKNMVSTSKDTQEAFTELGVSVTDANGELRDSNDIFWEVVQALSKVKNGTKRDTLAMQLFGKSADDLAGIIDDGGEALFEMGEEAENLGLILSQDALDSANEFNDSVDTLKATAKGTFQKIGAEIAKQLIPEMSDLAKYASKAAKNIDWSKVVKSVTDVLKKFIKLVKNAADVVIPALVKVLGFVTDNFDTLVGVLLTGITVFKTLKAAMAISNTVTAFKTAVAASTTAVNAAQKAQLAWNAAMSANVIGAVITAVALLVTGIGLLIGSTDDAEESTSDLNETQAKGVQSADKLRESYNRAKAKTDELTQAFKDDIEAANENAQSFRDLKDAAYDNASAELANIENTQNLWHELQTLTDENGKVKDGYQGRVDFILNELNNALGTEYDANNGIIGQYQDMQSEIDKLIEKKKAEILLGAYEETYREAVANVAEAEKARGEQAQKLSAMEAELAAKESELATARDNAAKQYDERTKWQAERRVTTLTNERDDIKAALDSEREAYKNLTDDVEAYYNAIDSYEIGSAMVAEGKTSEAVGYLNNLGNGFVTVASTAKLSADEQKRVLENQVITTEINLRQLERDYRDSSKNMTDAEKKEALNRINNAKQQATDAKKEFEKVGGNIVRGMADGVKTNSYYLTNAMNAIVEDALKAAKEAANIHSPSRLFRDEVGKYIGLGIGAGIDDSTKDVVKSVRSQVNGIRSAYGNSLSSVGGIGGVGSASVVNNYNQVINSPKALSRLDIYRQSKNLLGYMGGGY